MISAISIKPSTAKKIIVRIADTLRDYSRVGKNYIIDRIGDYYIRYNFVGNSAECTVQKNDVKFIKLSFTNYDGVIELIYITHYFGRNKKDAVNIRRVMYETAESVNIDCTSYKADFKKYYEKLLTVE